MCLSVTLTACPSVAMPFCRFGITDVSLEVADLKIDCINFRLLGCIGEIGLSLGEFSF